MTKEVSTKSNGQESTTAALTGLAALATTVNPAASVAVTTLTGATTVLKGLGWAIRKLSDPEKKAFFSAVRSAVEAGGFDLGGRGFVGDSRRRKQALERFVAKCQDILDDPASCELVESTTTDMPPDAQEADSLVQQQLNGIENGFIAALNKGSNVAVDSAMSKAFRGTQNDWSRALHVSIFRIGLAMLRGQDLGSNAKEDIKLLSQATSPHKEDVNTDTSRLWLWADMVADHLAFEMRKTAILQPLVERLEGNRERARQEFKVLTIAALLADSRRASQGLWWAGRGFVAVSAAIVAGALADGIDLVELSDWIARIGD